MLDLLITNHLRLRLTRFRKSNVRSELLGLQSDPAMLLVLFSMWDRGDLASGTTAGCMHEHNASIEENSVM